MCMLSIGAFAKEGSGAGTHVIECGQWITISATPLEGFEFTEWSDHSTDSIRQIQVNEDATYIALFKAIVCDQDSASWPIIVMHDWLLHISLDLQQINKMGYHFKPENVSWYEVMGEVDPILPSGKQGDDIFIGTGYEILRCHRLDFIRQRYALSGHQTLTTDPMCSEEPRTGIYRSLTQLCPSRRIRTTGRTES